MRINHENVCEVQKSSEPSRATSAATTVQRFFSCVEQVDAWMSSNRQLKMNADKTQLIWLGTRQQLDKLTTTELDLLSARVSFSTTVSDLGVLVDSQLSMADTSPHCPGRVFSRYANSSSCLSGWRQRIWPMTALSRIVFSRNQCINKTSSVAEMGDNLATTDMGRKLGAVSPLSF